MPLVDFDTIGKIGLIKDEKSYKIDPLAWTEMLNVRCVDGEVEAMLGRSQVFGALGEPPYFLLPISTPSQTFWVWTSLEKAFAWNGVTHSDITNIGGAYNAGSAADWNGTVLGGIMVLNNGVDPPQAWLESDPGEPLVDLPNWTANETAKVIRAFGPFLIAIHLTNTGTTYAHRVKWSHPADPGSAPSSWDETDPTKDTGLSELPDVDSGMLMDALPLKSKVILYKEQAMWTMRYIGGQSIFAFDNYLETAGILTTRCVCLVGDGARHFVVTQDDVLVHDGVSQPVPVLERKARRHLFSQISPTAFRQCFVFARRDTKEVWFCYPTVGATIPDKALVWNHVTGTVTEAETGFVSAASGPLESTTTLLWSTAVGTWADNVESWSSVDRRKTLVAVPTTEKILQMDEGGDYDGVAFTSRIGREGIAMLGRRRDGAPIVDFNRRKQSVRVWPRVQSNSTVSIRMGAQDTVEGPVRWTAAKTFDPATQKFVDIIVEGAALAIEVWSPDWFKMEGYKLDLTPLGEY